MKRMLVISDIHGELEKMERLLKEAAYDAEQDQLILLGDYVDRGPDAKGVIDSVMALKEAGALVLKGNHEDMMIKALTTDDERTCKRWVQINGGDRTLQSYGFTEKEPHFHSDILARHLTFLQSLDHYIETEDYIFVHAGVQPETPLAKTDPYTLMWIRQDFHNGYCGDKVVVFGHTTTDILHAEKNNYAVYFGANRIIGIDGGAVFGGQLNCLELPSRIVFSAK